MREPQLAVATVALGVAGQLLLGDGHLRDYHQETGGNRAAALDSAGIGGSIWFGPDSLHRNRY